MTTIKDKKSCFQQIKEILEAFEKGELSEKDLSNILFFFWRFSPRKSKA